MGTATHKSCCLPDAIAATRMTKKGAMMTKKCTLRKNAAKVEP